MYAESNNPLKNEPPPIVNGQNPATQQNGMQSPQFNLTGKFLLGSKEILFLKYIISLCEGKTIIYFIRVMSSKGSDIVLAHIWCNMFHMIRIKLT